jgi:hypothetical protein
MSRSVSDILLTPFCKIKFDIFDNSNEQVDENKILWYGLSATLGGAGGGHVQGNRSTEAALQLLLPLKEITLKEIKTRQSITEVVSGKLGEMLFTDEVAGVAQLWEKSKHNPRRICR